MFTLFLEKNRKKNNLSVAEGKILYVGADTSFDIDDALRKMMAYYERSIGNPILPLDTYSINDERIVKHLRKELRQDEQAHLLNINGSTLLSPMARLYASQSSCMPATGVIISCVVGSAAGVATELFSPGEGNTVSVPAVILIALWLSLMAV